MGKRPLLSTSQNRLGNEPSWKASGNHHFCVCLLSLLSIAWPRTPGCPTVQWSAKGKVVRLAGLTVCMSETRQRAHLGAGSRAQAWAIRRERGLVAAERGVDLTVIRSCTLVGRTTAGRGWFQWVVLTEGRPDVRGTQKWAVLYGLACTKSLLEVNSFACNIFQNHFHLCGIAPLLWI